MEIPDDIFTEPDPIDPDTLSNLGPLRHLAGIWEGTNGEDINPKADGPERRTFRERIELQPIDPQTNGPQLLYGLRYHTHINALDEENTFHDQIGYWLWEPTTGLIMQTLAIPRGQVALAVGHAVAEARRIVVEAARGSPAYGICSSGFLEEAFRTDSYRLEIEIHDYKSWSYTEDTTLMVRGRAESFVHKDSNRLTKVGECNLNPWLRIVREKGAP